MPDAPPGWYDDPYGGDTQRYWDGQAWAPDGEPSAERADARAGGDADAGATPSDAPIQISLEDLDHDPIPATAPLVAAPSLTVTLGPDTAEAPVASAAAGTNDALADGSGATTTATKAAAVASPPLTAAIPPPSIATPEAPDDGVGGRRPWRVALVVAVVVALLGVGFAAATTLESDDEPGPTTTSRPRGGRSPATTPASPATTPASPPATSPPATSPPATSPPATEAPSSGFEIGDPFSESCVVAWPSAPIRDSSSIQMQMSCPGVPSEFFLVQVVYPDPELEVTPSTGAMQVTGEVADVARSQLGYQVLVVVADDIEF